MTYFIRQTEQTKYMYYVCLSMQNVLHHPAAFCSLFCLLYSCADVVSVADT